MRLSWREFYWSWDGRLNRLQFILGIYSLGIPATILMMVLLPLVAPPAPGGGYIGTSAAWTVIAISQLLPAPFQVSMCARRLHDIGWSAKWLLAIVALLLIDMVFISLWPSLNETFVEYILLVPIMVLVLAMFVGLGTPASNTFGPPPRVGWLP